MAAHLQNLNQQCQKLLIQIMLKSLACEGESTYKTSQSSEWPLHANPLEIDVSESRIIKTNGNLWGPEHME